MSSGDQHLDEMMRAISPEDWLDYEAIDYRITRGSSGDQLNIHECPFCQDDRWKVYMNLESGLGNCFHCDQKFNLFKFIKAQSGLVRGNLRAYLEQVAKSVGWIPKPQAKTSTEVGTDVTLPVSLAIPIHGVYNLQYLENRGIPADVAHDFGLRYCESGVYQWKDQDVTRTQNYAGYIVIPIFDLDGKLTAFQGRDTTGTQPRKYLFPTGLPSAGKLLYNGHRCVGKDHIVVGEGVFDAIAIEMALKGASNYGAVATFGKHLSSGDLENDQLGRFCRLRDRGLRRVTMMWDSEPEAIRAALKAARLLRSVSLDTYIALLPTGCDPNEVDADTVRRAIANAVPFNSANEIKLRVLSNST